MTRTPTLHLVATTRIIDWAHHHHDRNTFLATCLARHLRRDWGELDTDDWELNDRAIACRSGRLLSAYPVPTELDPHDTTIWVITDNLDDPHTPTTILWPSDY
ncbi:MAG: type I restriction endonuclease subunit M [Acidimicrobiales bacterium]